MQIGYLGSSLKIWENFIFYKNRVIFAMSNQICCTRSLSFHYCTGSDTGAQVFDEHRSPPVDLAISPVWCPCAHWGDRLLNTSKRTLSDDTQKSCPVPRNVAKNWNDSISWCLTRWLLLLYKYTPTLNDYLCSKIHESWKFPGY